MLELISIVASLLLCILIPIEAGRIRGGWVHKKFAGDRAKFLANYRGRLMLLLGLGLVFGALQIAMAVIEAHPSESILTLVAGGTWFAVACVSFISLRTLAKAPEADATAGAGA